VGLGQECESFLQDVGWASAGVEEAGGSFRRVKGKDLCLLVALLAVLFWGDVVVVVVGLGAVVRVLRTGRVVTAKVAFLLLGERVTLASSSAFFFRVGILLLSLAFGGPGLNLLCHDGDKEGVLCVPRQE
jgi:hypothetical protein